MTHNTKNNRFEDAFSEVVLVHSMDGSSEWIFKYHEEAGLQNLEKKYIAGRDGFSGQGLYASKDIKAGEEILREGPLLLVGGGDEWDPLILGQVQAICSRIVSISPTQLEEAIHPHVFLPALSFAAASSSCKQAVLSLHCPELDQVPPLLLATLNLGIDGLFDNHLLSQAEVDKKTCLQVLLISLSNIFQVFRSPQDSWNGEMALYTECCRLNHSCLPNCWWAPVQGTEEGCISVRALVDIKAGEELCQSYLEEERWRPAHQRKKILENTKFFECQCPRCTADSDFCRGFLCPNYCKGTVFLPPQSEVPAAQEIRCEQCNCRVTSSWLTETRAFEEKAVGLVEKFIQGFQTMQSPKPLLELYSRCRRIMTQHWVLANVHDLLHDLYKMDKNFDAAAFHMFSRIKIVQPMYPRLTNHLAWLYEYLADDIAGLLGVPLSLFLEDKYLACLERIVCKIMPAKLAMHEMDFFYEDFSTLVQKSHNEIRSLLISGLFQNLPTLENTGVSSMFQLEADVFAECQEGMEAKFDKKVLNQVLNEFYMLSVRILNFLYLERNFPLHFHNHCMIEPVLLKFSQIKSFLTIF